jgi:hypothetical protein
MRCFSVSRSTRVTAHGARKPRALVNKVSMALFMAVSVIVNGGKALITYPEFCIKKGKNAVSD